jgi:hypothetical protein
MAIPTSTVVLVGVGGVLIYAGLSGVNPLMALKELSTGKPTPIRNEPSVDIASIGSVLGGLIPDMAANATGAGLPTLPRACERFAGDKYSQAKRWQNGYSDCSSFVGKGLKAIGVKPPTGSTTMSYYVSKEWKRIPESDVAAGDLAISPTHVVVCYGNGQAIGQQNPRVNVQKGPVKELMANTGAYFFLRYVGNGDTSTPKTHKTPKVAEA